MKPVSKKPHLESLTGLRFLAAIYIVLFHHGSALCILGASVCNLIHYGYISVSLFFVLSGFVLAYVYLDPENVQPIAAKRFWTARFARIYPLYLFSLLLSLPSFASKFEYFLGSLTETLKGVLTALLSLLLLQSWTPWTSTVWNTPAWAVSNEAFFYFIFPFTALPLARLSKRNLIRLMALLWILAILPPCFYLICSSSKICVDTLADQNILLSSSDVWTPFLAYSPWFHLPQFLIGVCAGLIFLRKEEQNSESVFSFVNRPSVLGFSCLLILIAFAVNSSFPYVLLSNGLLAPIFYMLIFQLAEGKGWFAKFFASKSMLRLGEASYAIYLFQNPLISFMKRLPIHFVKADAFFAPFFDLIFLISYLSILILFSLFATYAIENPMRKRLLNSMK